MTHQIHQLNKEEEAMENKQIDITFEIEKDTKNTIRFKEVLKGPLDPPIIGTLYVPKMTLSGLGFKEDQKLKVTLTIA